MSETIFFCYSGLPVDSFLRRGLGIGNLPELRVGRRTYRQVIQSLPGLPEGPARWFFSDRIMPSLPPDATRDALAGLAEAGCVLHGRERVVLLDLRQYPLDRAAFALQLAKGLASDLPFAVYSHAGEPAALFRSAGDLAAGTPAEDVVSCRLEPGAMLNLLVPADAIRLFNQNLLAREFNDIAPGANGYFVKRSAQKDKMRAEYEYLRNLPAPLRPFFPQCGEYEDQGETAGYEVEIVPALDAAKLLLNGFFAEREACVLFMRALAGFRQAQPRRTVPAEEGRAVMRRVFVEKGEKRLEALLALPEAGPLDRIARLQCGDSLAGFGKRCLEALERDIADHEDTELCHAHGDLFLGNILYDPARQVLKLVDPRGGSAEACLLPRWYDLAKLSHSFLGQYDLMAHDLMSAVMGEGMRLRLEPSPEIQGLAHLADVFRDYLRRERVDERRLRLYEASLFLSMMPLHREAPLRMTMQLVRAAELMDAANNML